MANSKSYSEALKGKKVKPVIMELSETFKYNEWTQFRNIALIIIQHAQKLKLPLKLDNITFGDGSCFMVSILQQCHREEIQMYLQDLESA